MKGKTLKYCRIVNSINSVFTYSAGFLVLLMIIIIVQDVIRRYFFNDPTSWALDAARFMLVYVFFLALGPALATGHHVATDLFTDKYNNSIKQIMNIIVYVLTTAFGIILLWQLTAATWEVFKSNDLFPTTVSIPMKYVYVITPIGTFQFILTSISKLIESINNKADLKKLVENEKLAKAE